MAKTETKKAKRYAETARQAARDAATPAKLTAAAELPPLPVDLPEGASRSSLSSFALLGRFLPIGVLHGAQLHRGFALRPFRMKEERELENIKARNPGISMADFVASVMAHMFTSVGPWTNFASLTEAERRLIVSQMYLADVMYAYIQLRIEAIGTDIGFDLKCPACRKRWRWTADLSQTDVVVAEGGPASLTWLHELRDGLTTPKGEVRSLVLQPPRWHAMSGVRTRVDESPNEGDLKLQLIASGIRQAGDHADLPITIDILEGLSKYDLERLSRSIDADTPGADLELESKCPNCGTEFSHALNWSWGFFFGGSSL
jgi:hypothetical protein